MYADDSTLYQSANTATEMTATLNKELQVVSDKSNLGQIIHKTLTKSWNL